MPIMLSSELRKDDVVKKFQKGDLVTMLIVIKDILQQDYRTSLRACSKTGFKLFNTENNGKTIHGRPMFSGELKTATDTENIFENTESQKIPI